MDNEVTDVPGPGTLTRRRLGRRGAVSLGAGGLAWSVFGSSHSALGASSATTPATTAGTTAASAPGTAAPTTSTTTAPPQRPTAGDDIVLNAVQSFEIEARQLYQSAIDAGALDAQQQIVFPVLCNMHDAHAQSVTGLLGRKAAQTGGTVFSGAADAFAAGGQKASVAAATVESVIVATLEDAIGRLTGTDGLNLLASIATASARAGTILADMIGTGLLDDLLVSAEAGALSVEG